ncbi:hypothetical protein G6F50_018446 [Rhizopus delemar]|uniref:TonB-dependent receptor-like beta-barrel domain-containing protein n=1 Tax=Rhizopus delemar TaxID=936053 RepID=A0A9P7BZ71_9FUNG|nr:hypothetical protein G6F50_018446 [Rhizopus delemar]
MDRWSANWTVRHISELTENCGDAAVFPVCSNQAAGTNTLSATTFHDMQVGYKIDWMKGLQLTAGLNNVFDKKYYVPSYNTVTGNNYYGEPRNVMLTVRYAPKL